MRRYCVNREPGPRGKHQVHDVTDANRSCLPKPANRVMIGGERTSSFSAFVSALLKYRGRADGCAHCMPECHRG